MPRPISVHIFGLRRAIDCQARTKNGQPVHSTTGKESTSSSQDCVAMSNQPSRWPNIASTVTATVSGSVHQKRRWKSRSSPSSSASSGISGSSVMPHLGQLPG